MEHAAYIIRPVKKKDGREVWKIRNHLLVRKNSDNPEKISFKKHSRWFEEKYFSGLDNHCFILENENDKAIGYCRFDFNDKTNAYLVSIAINPNFLGRGLGHYLLSQSLNKFTRSAEILAEVRKGNLPSVKLFQKNKFKIFKEDSGKYYFKLSLVRRPGSP